MSVHQFVCLFLKFEAKGGKDVKLPIFGQFFSTAHFWVHHLIHHSRNLLTMAFAVYSSDRENYFWSPGQNVRQALSVLPDIWSPCWTWLCFMPAILCAIVYGNVRQFLSSLPDIFPVLNPAGQNVQQCRGLLPDITRTLPDMSDMSSIFRNHWYRPVQTGSTGWIWLQKIVYMGNRATYGIIDFIPRTSDSSWVN